MTPEQEKRRQREALLAAIANTEARYAAEIAEAERVRDVSLAKALDMYDAAIASIAATEE